METNCWNCKKKIPNGIMLCPHCQVVVDELMVEDLDDFAENEAHCWNCKNEIPEGLMFCPHCQAVVDEKMRDHLNSLDNNAQLPQIRSGIIVTERYEIKGEVGRGGMGIVYEAKDLFLNRTVALKLLPYELAMAPGAAIDLKKETAVAFDINHEHIVQLYNINKWLGLTFITTEFVSGETLSHRMAEKGDTFTFAEIVSLLKHLADALDYLHTHRPPLIHGDLKPSSIFISRDGCPKIADCGIARVIRNIAARVSAMEAVGTLLYMAPEQIRGKTIGPWTDVYALAAITYELVSGRPPFSTGDLKWQIVNETSEPIKDLTETQNQALMAGLAKNPEMRPQTAKQFVDMFAGEIPVDAQREKKRIEGPPSDNASDVQTVTETLTAPARTRFLKTAADINKRLKKPLLIGGAAVILFLLAFGSLGPILSQRKDARDRYGQLQVDSEPEGATVFINRREMGLTPLFLKQVKIGTAEIVVQANCYHDSRQHAQITYNEENKIKFVLKPSCGQMIVTSKPDGGKWFLDGTYMGITPSKKIFVDTGEHEIKVTKEGHIDWTTRVSFGTEKIEHIGAKLSLAAVSDLSIYKGNDKIEVALRKFTTDTLYIWIANVGRASVKLEAGNYLLFDKNKEEILCQPGPGLIKELLPGQVAHDQLKYEKDPEAHLGELVFDHPHVGKIIRAFP